MKANSFIYAPELKSSFRCNVKLNESRQLYLVNGTVQGAGAPLAISLQDGQSLDKMLQIIAIREGESKELSFSSNFSFGAASRGKVLLCSHTMGELDYRTEETVDISLGQDAIVEFTIMQKEHDRASHHTIYNINLAGGAVLNVVFLAINGGVLSNEINVTLEGERAEANLSGLCLADGQQVSDYRLTMEHRVGECRSTQLFKGIIGGKGTSHFDGLIKVVPDAQKTEAYQANHNLLVSDDARAFSKPQLEIYADDVKCSHGATVGRLNEDELFYMRTRGIPLEEALILQQTAFASEVIEKISTPELKEIMTTFVEKRLRKETF